MMRKIGVEIVIKPYCGGSYQYWFSILNALKEFDKTKYKIYVISKDDSWDDIVSQFGYTILRYGERRKTIIASFIEKMIWKYNTLFLKRLYVRITNNLCSVKKEKLDIILADSALGMGNALNIPTIIPIHDLMHRYESDVEELKEGYEYREGLYRQEVRKAELVLVDSELGKQHLIESYSDVENNLAKKARVLPFIPPVYIYNGLEKKPQIILPEKYIFYPAQFWSHKNHIRLLEAVRLLKDKNIEISVVLVGSEQNNSNCVSDTIRELRIEENVTILGYVSNEEMVYLYKHARALVMPTLLGPTNIPPLEAFYLGCPVATSRIYAIPDQLGDAALYFDPRSVDEIVGCIERLWNNDVLCNELIEKGYEHSKSWGTKQFADRLNSIISEYLEG